MPIIGGSIAALGGIGASLIGGKQAAKAAQAASETAAAAQMAMFNQMMKRLDAVEIPDIEKQRIALDYAKDVNNYSPEIAQAIQAAPTAFEDVMVDPRLRASQMDALSGLEERAMGGLTASDLAEIADIRRGISGAASARDATILQNMEQRGLGGSGAELVNRMQSGQDAQQMAAQETEKMAALNQQAKLAALQEMGGMASQIRGQDYGEQAQLASAKDLINQFNTQNRINTQQSNIDRINQARMIASQSKQAEEAARAAARQQEETTNKGLYAQKFNQELAKATGAMPAGQQMISSIGQQGTAQAQAAAQGTQQMWSGIGQGISGIGSAVGSYYTPQTHATDTGIWTKKNAGADWTFKKN